MENKAEKYVYCCIDTSTVMKQEIDTISFDYSYRKTILSATSLQATEL